MHLLDLPDEILDEIISYLVQWQPQPLAPAADARRKQNMRTVCLTSKRLLPFGRKALYRYPSLVFDPSYQYYECGAIHWDHLLQSIASCGSSLGRYVQRVHASSSMILPLLSATPNLQQLSLHMDQQAEIPDTTALLCGRVESLTRLQQLRLDFAEVDSGVYFRKCLSVCPASFKGELQLLLVLASKIKCAHLDEPVPSRRLEFTHLNFIHCSITTQISHEVAQFLQSDGVDKVDFYECAWGGSSRTKFLDAYKRSVTRIDIDEDCENPFPAVDLRQYRKLERLALIWCESSESAMSLLDNVSSNLRALNIGNPGSPVLSKLVEVLPRLPNLRKLFIQLRQEEWDLWEDYGDEWQEVLAVAARLDAYCKEKHIEIWPESFEKALQLWEEDRTEQYWPDYRHG